MENDFEDKSGPKKNVEAKLPSSSEMVGPRVGANTETVPERFRKGSTEEKRELERLRAMGVSTDDVSSRGANIRAQGVTHEEPIILPRYNDNQPQYEEGEMIVNDLGDTVPAIKLSSPQMKKPLDPPKPGEPLPPPPRK